MVVLRRILGRLALILVSGLLAVAALELVLRLAAPADEGCRVWPPHLETTLHPRPEIMPGVEGPSRFRVNSRGLRGDEPPEGDAHRVLCVGGSTTECLYLDQEESWPGLLQTLLADALESPGTRVKTHVPKFNANEQRHYRNLVGAAGLVRSPGSRATPAGRRVAEFNDGRTVRTKRPID